MPASGDLIVFPEEGYVVLAVDAMKPTTKKWRSPVNATELFEIYY
jgi:hypothetical protein